MSVLPLQRAAVELTRLPVPRPLSSESGIAVAAAWLNVNAKALFGLCASVTPSRAGRRCLFALRCRKCALLREAVSRKRRRARALLRHSQPTRRRTSTQWNVDLKRRNQNDRLPTRRVARQSSIRHQEIGNAVSGTCPMKLRRWTWCRLILDFLGLTATNCYICLCAGCGQSTK